MKMMPIRQMDTFGPKRVRRVGCTLVVFRSSPPSVLTGSLEFEKKVTVTKCSFIVVESFEDRPEHFRRVVAGRVLCGIGEPTSALS